MISVSEWYGVKQACMDAEGCLGTAHPPIQLTKNWIYRWCQGRIWTLNHCIWPQTDEWTDMINWTFHLPRAIWTMDHDICLEVDECKRSNGWMDSARQTILTKVTEGGGRSPSVEACCQSKCQDLEGNWRFNRFRTYYVAQVDKAVYSRQFSRKIWNELFGIIVYDKMLNQQYSKKCVLKCIGCNIGCSREYSWIFM